VTNALSIELARKFFLTCGGTEILLACYITCSLLPPSRDCVFLRNFRVFLTEPKSINPSYPMLSASIRPAKH